jgi:hypothetical protein
VLVPVPSFVGERVGARRGWCTGIQRDGRGNVDGAVRSQRRPVTIAGAPAVLTGRPSLNSRWEQAGVDYDTAAGKANNGYDVRGYRNMPDDDPTAVRQEAAGVRDRRHSEKSSNRYNPISS